MFSFLDVFHTNTGRKIRESCAKDAKKTEMRSSVLVLLATSINLSFDFFASFAQLLRLLRPVVLVFIASQAIAQAQFQNIGRPATPAEVKAWDIDVRPDFKGLPPGRGSVIQGEKIWVLQCASCHGEFGESNEVFTPIAGGTTAKDIETGRVAALVLGANSPQRTTLMKLSSLSTLWDYVNRAMPWTAPKSLTADEVYAVTAYMLNLGNIVPNEFTLSHENIRDVQKRMPNRNGMVTAHAMWPGKEIPGLQSKVDAQGSACMKNCATEPKVASLLPEYARDAHGNLADQSRGFGASRGAQTLKAAAAPKPVASENTAQMAAKATDVTPLLQKYACIACHAADQKLVGPSWKEVTAKQGSRSDAAAYLASKVKAGGQGVYGQIPMPAQSLSEAEAAQIAAWLLAKK
jgi:S-disulfanyl-L-cysteine oxidoreductase SoxD